MDLVWTNNHIKSIIVYNFVSGVSINSTIEFGLLKFYFREIFYIKYNIRYF